MGAGLFGGSCPGQDRLHLELGLSGHIAAVVHRLRAVGAVLLAAAGFDTQQGGQLNPIPRIGLAVHLLGLPEQIHQRQLQERLDLSGAPVVAHRKGRGGHGSQEETDSTPPKRRWRFWKSIKAVTRAASSKSGQRTSVMCSSA